MIYLSTSPLSIWIILYTFLLTSVMEVMAARLPDIYWNSTNPIFRIDNTDHIIDVNRGNTAYEFDQININCPMYSNRGTREDVETYIIYNVSKEEYDSCHIANPAVARTIAVCDKPFLNRYYTITFRPFTPQPGGLEFRPGQDYYFIGLSAKPGEPNPSANCRKHSMKVVFKVCCQSKLNQPVIAPSTHQVVSTTVAPSTSTVSSSTVRNYSVVTYPGVIVPKQNNNNNNTITFIYPSRINPSPPARPRYPPPSFPKTSHANPHLSIPKDEEMPPRQGNKPPYKGRNPYPPYHNPSINNPYHPNHPSQVTTTNPTGNPYWWTPHHTSQRPDFKRNPSHTNDIRPKNDGLNSASHTLTLPWTISCLTLASALTWSQLSRSWIWLS